MAILTVMTILPRDTHINICLDSQAAIKAIQGSREMDPILGTRKYKNWHILEKIQELRKSRNISLTLEKVLAHSGIPGNEKADQLAKIDPEKGMKPGHKIVKHNPLDNSSSIIKARWKESIIEKPIKDFCHTIFKAKRLAQWHLLNRTRSWLEDHITRSINWEMTYSCLHPSPINNGHTSPKDHRIRKFCSNLWNEELPVKTKLHNRSPLVYTDDKCPKCGEQENSMHPFECEGKQDKICSFLYTLITQELSSRALPTQKQNIKSRVITETKIQYDYGITQITRGVVHKDLTKLILTITGNKKTTDKCIQTIMSKLRKFLLQIWTERCEMFNDWEKTRGINTKMKRKHKPCSNSKLIDYSKENEIKDQFVDLVNEFMDRHIKVTQISSPFLDLILALARLWHVSLSFRDGNKP
jgi:hypothetical protein